MGSTQSVQLDEDEEEEDGNGVTDEQRELGNPLMKRVLEQEPEMLPCHASASPLSPQLSTVGTPHLGPSIKVWDPYNVLSPPPHLPPAPVFSRSYSSDAIDDDDRVVLEVFLINHGESSVGLRPDLVSGRLPESALTPNGKRQARALAVLLNSQGIRFDAVYSSPLDRARITAISVCRELDFTQDQIQYTDELLEMSQGQWEGCLRSEIYTPEMVNVIDRLQPDFCAPSGESLRHVEFRMIQFLNVTVLRLQERLRTGDMSLRHSKEYPQSNSHEQNGNVLPPSHWDLLYKQKPGLSRKISGKSRLQIVTKHGDHETEDESSNQETNNQDSHLHDNGRSHSSSSCCIGVFTHAVAIKCLLTGILGCSPVMSNKICIDDSSLTVLHHSTKTGWQVKRVNDTAHLRLL